MKNAAGTQLDLEQSTNGTTWTTIPFTNNTNTSWNLITIPEGQIPTSATLSLRSTQLATAQMRLDEIKLSKVSAAFTLKLTFPTAVCDASTIGTDTYTETIPFAREGNTNCTITPSSRTVSGDNPTTVASGNIKVSGISEGSVFSATITGRTCNVSTYINSPECKPINPLPYVDHFNYTVGNSLGAEPIWINVNSGNNVLPVAGKLTYPGTKSSGNSVSISGAV